VSLGDVIALFTEAFGAQPLVVTSAPGRVNLIGEHLDYNGGAVLPIAIEQRTWVAIGPGVGSESEAVSREQEGVARWDWRRLTRLGDWRDYVAGSLAMAEPLGLEPGPYRLAVMSDVPVGAGLSSSAALEVGVVAAAASLAGVDLDVPAKPTTRSGPLSVRRRIAEAAHDAETSHVGVQCGIMDQFASALCRVGMALHLQCDSGDAAWVPFDRGVLIVDTGVPRALRDSHFNTRRRECEAALALLRIGDPTLATLAQATPEHLSRTPLPETLARRATHVLSEQRRVQEFVALGARRERGSALGTLLNASHRSLRDDYECSSPELDWVAEHSLARVGIDGARLTGAGWGGCAIVVGEPGALVEFAPDLSASFALAWGREPRIWHTTPQDGVRREQ